MEKLSLRQYNLLSHYDLRPFLLWEDSKSKKMKITDNQPLTDILPLFPTYTILSLSLVPTDQFPTFPHVPHSHAPTTSNNYFPATPPISMDNRWPNRWLLWFFLCKYFFFLLPFVQCPEQWLLWSSFGSVLCFGQFHAGRQCLYPITLAILGITSSHQLHEILACHIVASAEFDWFVRSVLEEELWPAYNNFGSCFFFLFFGVVA